jgi:hypothetical protein
MTVAGLRQRRSYQDERRAHHFLVAGPGRWLRSGGDGRDLEAAVTA